MNRGRLSAIILAFALLSAPAAAADRVALVIGNGAYQKAPALANPPRDATDVAGALQRLDFKVTLLTNLTGAQTRRALVEFGHAVETAKIAIVFYAGHGMEIGGENWLIPTDAELLSDTDVESEAVSLRSVNLQVGKATQLGLIILDACRNNPFAAKMRRSLSVRSVARGLAPTEPTENVLIAYAARDGTTAGDGDGRNSPFTTALLRHIETPGLEISFLFRRVRDDVMAATHREQQPFVYGSLSKDEIYLRAPAATTAAKLATPVPQAPSEDEQFWQAIRTSNVPGLYEEFLSRYPKSPLIAEARARLVDLNKEQAVPAASPGPAAPANAGGGEAAQTITPSKVRPFTTADRERVAALAAELKLSMPPFTIATAEAAAPDSYSRFIGVWSNRRGWGNGKGRTGMLVITEVSATGLASGYYLWGPPTKASWKPSPAGYVHFVEYIFGDTLIFRTDETIAAKLDSRNVLTLSASRSNHSSDKSSIELRPIWQLVGPTIDIKPSTPTSTVKTGKAASGAVSHDEAGHRELATSPQPREATDELRAQCRREAHRLQNNDTSRIEACVRNGGRI